MEEVLFDQLPDGFKGKGNGHMQLIELTGVSLVGFKRGNGEYIVNPSRELVMQPHDKIFVLGNSEQIEAVQARLKL